MRETGFLSTRTLHSRGEKRYKANTGKIISGGEAGEKGRKGEYGVRRLLRCGDQAAFVLRSESEKKLLT